MNNICFFRLTITTLQPTISSSSSTIFASSVVFSSSSLLFYNISCCCVNLTWWQSCCCFSTNCCCCCCGDVNCCRIVSRLRRLCEYQVWLHTASLTIMTHYWSLSSPQHCLTHCASPPLTSLPDTQCWAVELMRMLYAIVFDRLWSETSINSIANTHCLMMMSHCRGEQHPLIWCNNQMLLQLSSLVVSWQLDVESGYLLLLRWSCCQV